jgi:hypothetical protein
MCDLWADGTNKLLIKETRASKIEGPCQAGGLEGPAQPYHVGGKTVYPQSETEMDPFVWYCKE